MRNPLQTIKKALATFGSKRSPHWPAARRRWLATTPTCAACGGTLNLEVHHKVPFHLHPELELEPSNFITLCEPWGIEHHLKIGHTINGKSSWKINNPDVVLDAAFALRRSQQ